MMSKHSRCMYVMAFLMWRWQYNCIPGAGLPVSCSCPHGTEAANVLIMTTKIIRSLIMTTKIGQQSIESKNISE